MDSSKIHQIIFLGSLTTHTFWGANLDHATPPSSKLHLQLLSLTLAFKFSPGRRGCSLAFRLAPETISTKKQGKMQTNLFHFRLRPRSSSICPATGSCQTCHRIFRDKALYYHQDSPTERPPSQTEHSEHLHLLQSINPFA